MRVCPICKEESNLNSKHIKICFKGDSNYRIKFYQYNFPLVGNKDFIEDRYINKGDSIPILCKLVGGLDIRGMCYVLNYHNIPIRSIKESHTRKEYLDRIESTNLERYGAVNPLCKGTTAWKKRNDTVLEKYGVENVWQCIDDFSPKLGKKSKHSYLNARLLKVLNDNHFDFSLEFKINYKSEEKSKWFFFDFKIGNYLLEVNGDYWHANPIKYKKNSIINFPKGKIVAEDIWERDKYKKQIAESNGYQVLYLWESEINKMDDREILYYLKDKIN